LILVLLEKRGNKPYGGAEHATQLILALLADAGFDITVLTGNRNFHVDGVKCIYSPHLEVPSKVHLWTNMFMSNVRNWLRKIIRKVDVVYIPRLAYPAIPLAKRCEAKIIVHLHDYQPITYCAAIFNHSEKYRMSLMADMKTSLQFEILENESVIRSMSSLMATPLNKLSTRWIREASEIICVSRRQRDIIASVAPKLVNKLKVIYNLLPTVPLVKKKLGDPTFAYLGGDNYVKGFYAILEASQKILKLQQTVKYLFAGDFKDVNRVLVERLNEDCKGTYDVLGYLDYEDVLRLHCISHAILFPSI
jgi:glycosyltransferase involved in cell wall biosynthesis